MKTSTKIYLLLGLAARLASMPFGGSAVAHKLFIPFLDAGINNLGANPWTLNEPKFFPYGSVLYAMLALPRLLVHAAWGADALANTQLSIALLKAPLLVLDIGLLWLLKQIAPKRTHHVVLFYWLNPILFFVTYLHVQLDVAATFFLVAALLLVMRGRVLWSALLMGLATLCKAHVVIVVPLFLAFFWHRHFRSRALLHMARWSALWGMTTALGFVPHWRAQTLAYVTTASPQAFQVFDARIDLDRGQVVYFGIGILAVLLGRLCLARRLSELGLVFGSGLVFGFLLLITNSSPGWYFWPMPFIVLLYSNYTQASVPLYGVYCLLYLVYFAILPHVPPGFLHSAVFTLLQTTLAVIVYSMWRIVVRYEAPLGLQRRPILFGIAGDSGTGKNVLSQVIADIFDAKASTLLEGDDYHKWERGNPKWGDYTHLDPKANHLDELAVHTADLLQGRLVWQPQYDHACGQFTAPREIRSSKVVIVQGLHALYLRDMRAQFNVKVFLAPHPAIRRAWKIHRDVMLRGHPLDKVLRSMAARAQDAKLHITPQRDTADWVIETGPVDENLDDSAILKGTDIQTYTRHILWNDVPVSQLCGLLQGVDGCNADLKVVAGDMDRITLTVRGRLSTSQIASLAALLYPDLRTITNASRPPIWQPDDHGVKQLIALAFLQRQQQHAPNH